MSDRSAKSAPAEGANVLEYDVVHGTDEQFTEKLNRLVAEGWEVAAYAIHAMPFPFKDGEPVQAAKLVNWRGVTHSALIRRSTADPTPPKRRTRETGE